jgi:putative peptidoglycan lipid II flippase
LAGLKKASAILIGLALISKFLGLGREVLIAYFFGTTGELDAYIVGMTWPLLILMFFAGGAFTGAFIPVFTGYLARGERENAQRFSGNMLCLLSLLFLGLTVAAEFAAPQLVTLMAPGMASSSSALAVRLTRIMMFSLIFFFLATYIQSVLNSFNHFTLPGLRQTVLNISIIIAALLSPILGIEALAYGFLAGSVLSIIVQLPALKNRGWALRPALNFSDPSMKSFFTLVLPLMGVVFLVELNILIDRAVASFLGEGNIAALGYSERLMDISRSVLGVSVATVVFPKLSTDHALGGTEEFSKTLTKAIRILFFTCWPITLGFLFFSEPAVRLLFGRGVFGDASVDLTATAIFHYSFAAFFISINYVLMRAFHAQKRVLLTLAVTSGALIINMELNLILSTRLGLGGITLATSISSGLITFWFIRELYASGIGIDKPTIVALLRILAAQTPALAAAYALFVGLCNLLPGQNIALIISWIMIIPLLALSCKLWKIEEYNMVVATITNKIRNRFPRAR